MNSKKRLFIAIALPAEIKEKLEEMQKQLRSFALDAKWVKPGGIHLTLKFLGYVEEEKIQRIQRSITPLVGRNSFVTIRVSGCGFFPTSRRPAVLWAGVQANELLPLQQKIEDATSQLGFEKENRVFSPHLTLARFREPKGLLPLVHETEKWRDALLGEFTAKEVNLYQSILKPQGAEYLVVRSFPLKATQ